MRSVIVFGLPGRPIGVERGANCRSNFRQEICIGLHLQQTEFGFCFVLCGHTDKCTRLAFRKCTLELLVLPIL
jgi:hypothetical protein